LRALGEFMSDASQEVRNIAKDGIKTMSTKNSNFEQVLAKSIHNEGTLKKIKEFLEKDF
jgi:hypothetical protein